MFPFRLEHKEDKNTKICWFQSEDHANKYIARAKLKKSDYKLEAKDVAIVGKGTGRKGTQKRSSRRQSSSN
jgi:hypothetical protein